MTLLMALTEKVHNVEEQIHSVDREMETLKIKSNY